MTPSYILHVQQQQARSELRVEDALMFLDQIKLEFHDRPHVYYEFLQIMKAYKLLKWDALTLIGKLCNLFRGNRKISLGLNKFLPDEYKIEVPEEGQNGTFVLIYPVLVPGSNTITIDLYDMQSPTITIDPTNAIMIDLCDTQSTTWL